jgi:hypothetical protein
MVRITALQLFPVSTCRLFKIINCVRAKSTVNEMLYKSSIPNYSAPGYARESCDYPAEVGEAVDVGARARPPVCCSRPCVFVPTVARAAAAQSRARTHRTSSDGTTEAKGHPLARPLTHPTEADQGGETSRRAITAATSASSGSSALIVATHTCSPRQKLALSSALRRSCAKPRKADLGRSAPGGEC